MLILLSIKLIIERPNKNNVNVVSPNEQKCCTRHKTYMCTVFYQLIHPMHVYSVRLLSDESTQYISPNTNAILLAIYLWQLLQSILLFCHLVFGRVVSTNTNAILLAIYFWQRLQSILLFYHLVFGRGFFR